MQDVHRTHSRRMDPRDLDAARTRSDQIVTELSILPTVKPYPDLLLTQRFAHADELDVGDSDLEQLREDPELKRV